MSNDIRYTKTCVICSLGNSPPKAKQIGMNSSKSKKPPLKCYQYVEAVFNVSFGNIATIFSITSRKPPMHHRTFDHQSNPSVVNPMDSKVKTGKPFFNGRSFYIKNTRQPIILLLHAFCSLKRYII